MPDAPGRLVMLAPNWLGDAVMALPLVADIQRAWPSTAIAVAGRRAVVPLFEMVPGITHTVALEGGGGLSAMRSWRANAARLGAGGFDAALLLPNSFLAAWTTAQAHIPERWGFARDLRGRLLTRVLPAPRRDAHQAEYYQELGRGLGIEPGPRHARIEVSGDDLRRAEQKLADAGLVAGRAYVAMAPGAAYGRAKQWLPERFIELATLLAAQQITSVLIGARADQAVCAAIARNGVAIDLSGKTDLFELAAVLKLARAVVANDSGAMHLAAAVGSKVVAVFGPTNERKTAPLPAGADTPSPHVIATAVWCRPCMLRECPIDHRCMSRIDARAVLDAVLG